MVVNKTKCIHDQNDEAGSEHMNNRIQEFVDENRLKLIIYMFKATIKFQKYSLSYEIS